MGKGRANETSDGDSVSKGKNGVDVTQLDMLERDPNNLNPHLKVFFEDVIGEPDGAHSADCVWTNSYKCFWTGKDCCYTIITYVCSIPLAFCWGCEFACIQFCNIWSITPCLYLFNVNFSCFSKFWRTLIHCYCDPIYEAISLMFSQIHFNHISGAQSYKSQDITRKNLMGRKRSSNGSTYSGGETNYAMDYGNEKETVYATVP